MPEFSKDELKKFGRQARKHHDQIKERCWEVSHTFGGLLIDNGLPAEKTAYTVFEVRLGDDYQENHFIVELDGRYVKGVSKGESVWVDVSIDQFCDKEMENNNVEVSFGKRKDIEDVRVMFPDDPRRNDYGSISDFLDKGF